MRTPLRTILCLAPLVLNSACSSTATTVDTFADPADATRGVVAALQADNVPEADRIFSLYARSSVLRDSVFFALVEGAAGEYAVGDDASARRMVEFAQANFPSVYASADELESELRSGVAEGLAVVETAYAEATAALAALSQIQEAIDNEQMGLARERFQAFIEDWNGEPEELGVEVKRIEQALLSD